MTLQELITDLKAAGANENTLRLAMNCYELGQKDMREEMIYTWIPPKFVDMAIQACAEKAWIALVKHRQPWNVRQDVTEAIKSVGEK